MWKKIEVIFLIILMLISLFSVIMSFTRPVKADTSFCIYLVSADPQTGEVVCRIEPDGNCCFVVAD